MEVKHHLAFDQTRLAVSILRDSLEGPWEREVLIQGNAVSYNRAIGKQVMLPLHRCPFRSTQASHDLPFIRPYPPSNRWR
ncbi:MAG: hypothetical protein RLZZ609_990 [Cyanobacteriota bacterium]